MLVRPQALLNTLQRESGEIRRLTRHSSVALEERNRRLQRLAQQNTESFVDLAQHYLPELSRQQLPRTWEEVRDQIHDLLLQKEDHKHRLETQLDQNRTKILELESACLTLRSELDRARLVLSCKTGNFKKMMREDPAIVACNDAIEQIDSEIKCVIASLEHADSEAASKLPAYEQCRLFQYLQQRRFGTPEYEASVLERAWDRWVSKLIDYPKARKSYEYLSSTPETLRKLIDSKQDAYRNRLTELENARRRASERFGVGQERGRWESLRDQMQTLEEQLHQDRWHESCLVDDLNALEDVTCHYFEQAIEIFCGFLRSLEPQVLKIYAECTTSPVDDQICARIRHLGSQIQLEQDSSRERHRQVDRSKRYTAGLIELEQRLKTMVRETPAELLFGAELCFEELLSSLKNEKMTPAEVWRNIRKSMLRDAVWSPSAPPKIQTENPKDGRSHHRNQIRMIPPLEASFAAASDRLGLSESSGTDQSADASDILFMGPDGPAPNHEGTEFAAVATCRRLVDAETIVERLADLGLVAFHCTNDLDANQDRDEDVPDEWNVFIDQDHHHRAYNALLKWQLQFEREWVCSQCDIQVSRGYGICHQCGQHR